MELINNIRRNRPRLPPGVTLSPSCVELLGMLLVPQPEHRASLETFVSCAFLKPPVAITPPHQARGGGGSPSAAARAPERESGVSAGGSGAHLAEKQQQQQPQQPEQWSAGVARPTKTYPDAGQENEQVLGHPDEGAVVRTNAYSDAAGRATGGGGSGSGSGGGGAAAGAGSAAADARPTCDGSSSRKTETAMDPVGGRDGEWGWDWGGRGLTPALAAGSEGQSVVAHVVIADQGPLPALPALPFALGPFGVRGSFAEDRGARRGGGDGGGGDGGGGGVSEASTGFAFDLAFAGSPVHSRSRMVSAAAVPAGSGGGGGVGERERRSYSASDAVGPDSGRRTSVAAAPVAVIPAAVASASVDAAKNGKGSPVATPAAGHHRSHSFSGKSSPVQQHRSGDQTASSNTVGISTPPSQVYYSSSKHAEYASAAGVGGAAGGSPARAGGVSSSSSWRSSSGGASL